MSARDVAARLAAIKAVKDFLADLERATKAELMDHLDPGDRKGAILPDGTDVGTVSVTKGRRGGWGVVDEAAFLAWVRLHRPTALVESVRASDQADILARVEATGEVPDGVDQAPDGAAYVTVRQTPDQAAAVVAAWHRGALELPTLPQITTQPATSKDD